MARLLPQAADAEAAIDGGEQQHEQGKRPYADTGDDRRQVRELLHRDQQAQHEHLDHGPRADRRQQTQGERRRSRHCQQIGRDHQLQQGHDDGGEQDQRSHQPHIVLPKRDHGAPQRRAVELPLCRDGDDGKQIGDDEHDQRGDGQR